eukprot:CAMPEP_0171341226 /NCGR_PEP_ID=MMETSP0878-20121228/9668_1 /TAXON_ID=67004 /ORGANISM="Thalassiosira weissflogii, Strain CCMP1336" /LENGTH=505 /DNA_ID=CAMNT_0011843403 /DNA_START=95 /DNA_END=1612 /DNA_ORIENTATION=+
MMPEHNLLSVTVRPIDATSSFSILYNENTTIGQSISHYASEAVNDVDVKTDLVGERAGFDFSGHGKVELGHDFLRNFFVERIILPFIQSKNKPISLETDAESCLCAETVVKRWSSSIANLERDVEALLGDLLAPFAPSDVDFMSALVKDRFVRCDAVIFVFDRHRIVHPTVESARLLSNFLKTYARGIVQADFRGICLRKIDNAFLNEIFGAFDEAKLEHVSLGYNSLRDGIEFPSLFKKSLKVIQIHDTSQNPQHQKLRAALENCELTKISIRCLQLNQSIASIFEKLHALEYVDLYRVTTHNNLDVTETTAKSLIASLKNGSSNTLKVFSLEHFPKFNCIGELLTELGTCRKLKGMNLSHCKLDDTSVLLLSKVLTKSSMALEDLNLSFNNITAEGAYLISLIIPKCKHSLRFLRLNKNPLSDRGICYISRTISGCSNLEKIDLSYAGCEKSGLMELDNVISNGSLTAFKTLILMKTLNDAADFDELKNTMKGKGITVIDQRN